MRAPITIILRPFLSTISRRWSTHVRSFVSMECFLVCTNGPFYDTMTDDEFLARFVPYGQLPENLKSVCDARPDYDEWVKIMDSQYTATETRHDQN